MTSNKIRASKQDAQQHTQRDYTLSLQTRERLQLRRKNVALSEWEPFLRNIDFDHFNIPSLRTQIITDLQLSKQSDILKELIVMFTDFFLSNAAIYNSQLFAEKDDELIFICDVSKEMLDNLIVELFSTYFSRDLVEKSSNAIKRAINTIFKETYHNNIIQFRDCHLIDGEMIKGRLSSTLPRYRINTYVLDSETHHLPKEFNELTLHLCNYDKETQQVLLDLLSMSFANSVSIKAKYGKIINICGVPQAGKSTLANVLTKALGVDNVTAFSLADLEGYSLAEVVTSLVAIDDDSSATYVDASVSANIKRLVTAGQIQVRKIYESPITVSPTTQLIVSSNSFSMSEDKTDGWNRRFAHFSPKNQLKMSNDWHEQLMSDESCERIVQYLFNRYREIIEKDKEIIFSEQMLETSEYVENVNNSVKQYVESFENIEDVEGWPVKYFITKYNDFCEMNGLTPFKRNKILTILRDKFLIKEVKSKLSTIDVLIRDEMGLIHEQDFARIMILRLIK